MKSALILLAFVGVALAASKVDVKNSSLKECSTPHSNYIIDHKFEPNAFSFTTKSEGVISGGTWEMNVKKGLLSFTFTGNNCGDGSIKMYGIKIADYKGLPCPTKAGEELPNHVPVEVNSRLIPTGEYKVKYTSVDQDKKPLACVDVKVALA